MRPAIIAVLLAIPAIAAAEVYTWRDASGKIHYSDRPPMEAGASSRLINAPVSESDDVPVAIKNAAERKEANEKTAKEAGEKAAEAERQRTEDTLRQANCDRARENLSGIESGVIRFRVGESGAREGLDGAVREAELANARHMVEVNCAPPPVAKK
ncbi:MAG: DUF4124 domain-containing protein [Azoarcus sp.]|nr:DUF4124 domain-containing protein [Azoarcus sp.]